MKLTICRNELLKAAQSAANIVDKRQVVPILSHVKIATNGDSVLFTTTDQDSEIQISKPAQVMSEGVTTVSANLLKDIAARMPDGALVSLDLDGHNLIVKAGRQRYKMATLDADDFPELSAQPFESEQELSGDELSRILGRAKVAMSREETRYYLNGVAMQYREGKLLAVATDGHRLVKEVMDGTEIPDIIIPSKYVVEIERLAGEVDSVTLHVSESKVKLEAGDTVLSSKTIEGTFPDYTRVIPAKSDNILKAEAGPISVAASGVAVVSDQRTKSVKLTLSADSVNLSVRGSDNFAENDVECEWTGDEGFEIGVNAQYLADVLKLADKGVVRVYMGAAGDPLRIEFDESPETVAVVMPIRL